MNNNRSYFRRLIASIKQHFSSSLQGQGMVEYVVLVSLIVVLVVTVMTSYSTTMRDFLFDRVDENSVGRHEASLSQGLYDNN